MPNLEQFNAEPGKLDISDRGAESFAQAGRRAGLAFHQIGESTDKTIGIYQQHLTDMDVSNTMASMSTANGNFKDSWTKAAADPRAVDHPELGQAVLDQFGQSLDEIAGHAQTEQGRRIAERLATQYKAEARDRIAADTSDLATARWENNRGTFLNNTISSVIDDPSSLSTELGRYQEMASAGIPGGVLPAARAKAEAAVTPELQAITVAAYKSAIDKGEDDIAAGGQGAQLKWVEDQLAGEGAGFGYLPPDYNKESIEHDIQIARERGASRAAASQNLQDKALDTQGKADFASLDARVQAQERPGAAPDPTLPADIGAFTSQWGGRLPGESSSLQAGLTRMATPEEQRKLVPDNTPTATSMIQSLGTPSAPTDAQISQAAYTGAISDHVASILRDGNKAANDPAQKQALEQLHQMQSDMAAQITRSASGAPGVGGAINAMRQDSWSTYQGWLNDGTGKTPGEVIDIMRNQANKHNFFYNMMPDYVNASRSPDPSAALKGMPDYAAFTASQYGGQPNPLSGPTDASQRATAIATPSGAPLSPDDFSNMSKVAGGH